MCGKYPLDLEKLMIEEIRVINHSKRKNKMLEISLVNPNSNNMKNNVTKDQKGVFKIKTCQGPNGSIGLSRFVTSRTIHDAPNTIEDNYKQKKL